MLKRLLQLALILAFALPCSAAEVGAGLAELLEGKGSWPVWVFFADKGVSEDDPEAAAASVARLSDRALARRAKVGAGPAWTDLPNDPAYLGALNDLGFSIRAESRWLAAVTVTAHAADLPRLAELPFVSRIEPVRPSHRDPLPLLPAPSRRTASGSPYAADGRYLGSLDRREDPLDYGGSLVELTQVNVPAVHQTGNHGEGVVIGMMDTGFNTTHEALLSVDVLGAWDFINDDGIVANEPGDSLYQQNHGTMTLSTIAGYKPGSLIGPAFAASYYLAKTEDTTQEEPIEEDWWVEGIEWLEAQGCDIVSSSLAYDNWYVFEDFDGNTAVTTIAADMAVALGVLVVNSAGNYRQSTGHIAAPADGDSVIACGAVDEFGVVAGFSSPGPTADGRIKPDVSAMGVSNNVAIPGTLDEYTGASGTSFSCPLSAGVAALLLSAEPGATPMQLRDALRGTASQPESPDNDLGWGILDALAAIGHLGVTAAQEPVAAARLLGNWPNPFNPVTTLSFALPEGAEVSLTIHDSRGRLLRTLVDASLPAGSHSARGDGRDERGAPASSGLYLARLHAAGASHSRKLLLLK